MNKITPEYVFKAHYEIIKLTGGRHGIINGGLVESAVNGIYQTFDSKELYPTIEDKAAMLCYSLIKNHAFEDGNKRTGVNMMFTFLSFNNYTITTNNKELADLGLGVANSEYDREYIINWIRCHKC